MRVAYFDLGFSREQYGLEPTRYGGGAVLARYMKEDPDPSVELHVFAPAESFENMGPTERRDRCYVLPEWALDGFRRGAPIDNIPNLNEHFDLIIHPHTCATINRGSFKGPIVHFCGFGGDAGHPGNDYILLYDPSFRAQFGERAKYVRIGKPVADQWLSSVYATKERFVFQCTRHDNHLGGIPLAKRCLAEGFKGVFAGPKPVSDYPLLDYIDGKTTIYLGEIDEQIKMDYHRRAGLYGMLHEWEACPFNQSIIEAQGQGTPIYTYPKGPFLSTYLKHRYNGFDANECSLTQAWSAADMDVSYASWKSAQEYSVPVMLDTFTMRLSYVTVCVDYLDLLKVAHHHNLSAAAFDDYVIVTTQRDLETTAWTQAHKEVMPVYTDAFYRNGATFNKGLALSEGLNALKSICDPEWVAIMDADTFVPPDWRAQIVGTPENPPKVKLDKEWMYGARRVLLPTWEEYERLWRDDIETFESPKGFAFGWLQMYHWQSQAFQARIAAGEMYPQGNDCTEVDWKFFRAWGNLEPGYERATGRIAELPFKVFNLGPHGVNHRARVSAPFTPPS